MHRNEYSILELERALDMIQSNLILFQMRKITLDMVDQMS